MEKQNVKCNKLVAGNTTWLTVW